MNHRRFISSFFADKSIRLITAVILTALLICACHSGNDADVLMHFDDPSHGISLSGTSNSDSRVISFAFQLQDGFQMVDEDGNHSGYCYDYLQKIRTYTGWTYEYIGDDGIESFASLLPRLVSGDIDLMGNITYTPERSEYLLYSDFPMGTEYSTIYVKLGNNNYFAEGYSDWNGMRIGVLEGTYYIQSIREFAAEKGFDYVEEIYESDEATVEALEAGEIDAFVAGSMHTFEDVAILEQFDPQLVYFATGLGNEDIIDAVNKAMVQLESSDPGFTKRLLEKYYQINASGEKTLAGSEDLFLENVRESGEKMRLLVNPDACPLSYIGEDGEFRGILVEYASQILDKVGLPYTFIPVITREEYLKSLLSSDYDIVIDYYSNYNFSETHGILECEPYYQTSLYKVMSGQSPDSGNRYVECTGYFFTGIFFQGQRREALVAGTIDTLQETSGYLLNHQDMSVMLPAEIARVMIAQEPTNGLREEVVSYQNCNISMAVPLGSSSDLISILNKVSRYINVIDAASIQSRYDTSHYEARSFVAIVCDHPVGTLLAIVLILIIAGLIYFILLIRQNAAIQKKLNAELSVALTREKEASDARDKFFNSLSHDMRTPLNGILGMARMAQTGSKVSDDILDKLYKIEDSGQYLMLMLEDSLTMSNGGNPDNIALRPELVQPRDVWNSLLNIAEMYARERNIRIVTRQIEIVDMPTLMDSRRLKQAVLNIVSNAVKYSHLGGTIEMDLMSKIIDDTHVGYTLTIQDHGIGMTAEFQQHMFEQYTQENRVGVSEFAGRGLGMSIAKSLVEKMSGDIEVTSQENIGTVVRMTFVFEVSEVSLSSATASKEPAKKDLDGVHALYCEDNELNMDILCAILETVGISVDRAENGRIGYEKFRDSQPGTYDVILMDIRMPEMDGYEAARAIRALDRPDSRTIPIIAVSANAFDEDREAAIEAGMNGHMAKPVDPKIILKEIRDDLAKVHSG